MRRKHVPVSQAAIDLIDNVIDLEEVKTAFIELYTIWSALGIALAASVRLKLEVTQADIIAFYLLGYLAGGDYEGATDFNGAWVYALDKIGWATEKEGEA